MAASDSFCTYSFKIIEIYTEAYIGHCQTSKMEFFTKLVNPRYANGPFPYPRKLRKTRYFFMFSGGIETETDQCHGLG